MLSAQTCLWMQIRLYPPECCRARKKAGENPIFWFFRVMGMSICDPDDREKSFGAPVCSVYRPINRMKPIGSSGKWVGSLECFVRPRKIVRGPRCPNYPPDCPNLAICPNDFSLDATSWPRPVRCTYPLTG